MYPLIPHRSLLGLVKLPWGRVRPGDIVAWDRKGKTLVCRVIQRDGDRGTFLGAEDYGGRCFRVDENQYVGSVVWRCYKGHKLSLLPQDRPLGRRLFLHLYRREARLRALLGRSGENPPLPWRRVLPSWPLLKVLTLLRRGMCRRIHASRERNPDKREVPYLLRTLHAAMLPGNDSSVTPPEGLDWEVCLDLALSHRICGQVSPLWARLPKENQPPEHVRDMLRRDRRSSEGSWNDSLELLRLITPALSAGEVPFLVLKGPVLAGECYGNPRDRSFGDLDILVPPDKIRPALELLAGLGFKAKTDSRRQSLILWGHFHLSLSPPSPRRVPLEVHWGLVDRANFLRLEVGEVFPRAREVHLPGVSVKALSPVDEFVYLCVHLSRHGILNRLALEDDVPAHWIAQGHSGNRLLWFLDLHYYLERHRDSLVPGRLWERATDWNAAEEVRQGLVLTQKLFPSQPCEDLLRRAPSALTRPSRGSRRGTWLMGGRKRLRLLKWAMQANPAYVVRPVRLLTMIGLFFPGPERVRRYYGARSAWETGWHSLLHPAHMCRKMFLP